MGGGPKWTWGQVRGREIGTQVLYEAADSAAEAPTLPEPRGMCKGLGERMGVCAAYKEP